MRTENSFNPVVRQQAASEQALLRAGKSSSEGFLNETAAADSQDAGVTVEISEDGKALQNGVRKQQGDDAQWMLKWAQEMYKQQAEASDKASKAIDDVAKAMEIARRISRGDIVPPRDEKKLIEFNADLYQAAKAAAVANANRKHKKYKSLYDEDEDASMRDKMRALNQEEERKNAEAVSAAMAAPGGGAAGAAQGSAES